MLQVAPSKPPYTNSGPRVVVAARRLHARCQAMSPEITLRDRLLTGAVALLLLALVAFYAVLLALLNGIANTSHPIHAYPTRVEPSYAHPLTLIPVGVAMVAWAFAARLMWRELRNTA
jgi:hypothetical protein